jgi:hypothetical protein
MSELAGGVHADWGVRQRVAHHVSLSRPLVETFG